MEGEREIKNPQVKKKKGGGEGIEPNYSSRPQSYSNCKASSKCFQKVSTVFPKLLGRTRKKVGFQLYSIPISFTPFSF